MPVYPPEARPLREPDDIGARRWIQYDDTVKEKSWKANISGIEDVLEAFKEFAKAFRKAHIACELNIPPMEFQLAHERGFWADAYQSLKDLASSYARAKGVGGNQVFDGMKEIPRSVEGFQGLMVPHFTLLLGDLDKQIEGCDPQKEALRKKREALRKDHLVSLPLRDKAKEVEHERLESANKRRQALAALITQATALGRWDDLDPDKEKKRIFLLWWWRLGDWKWLRRRVHSRPLQRLIALSPALYVLLTVFWRPLAFVAVGPVGTAGFSTGKAHQLDLRADYGLFQHQFIRVAAFGTGGVTWRGRGPCTITVVDEVDETSGRPIIVPTTIKGACVAMHGDQCRIDGDTIINRGH